MATAAPIGRDQAISLVLEGSLPVWLGAPHPRAMIVEQEGQFRIRELVIEHVPDDASARARSVSWMPNHHYTLGRPTGEVYVEAPTRDELVAQMRAMDWPPHW